MSLSVLRSVKKRSTQSEQHVEFEQRVEFEQHVEFFLLLNPVVRKEIFRF
jgi:hypothetical protein